MSVRSTHLAGMEGQNNSPKLGRSCPVPLTGCYSLVVRLAEMQRHSQDVDIGSRALPQSLLSSLIEGARPV